MSFAPCRSKDKKQKLCSSLLPISKERKTCKQKVLTGKVYSYKRGETSLLEVLNAQRTYNDVQQNYYQALFNYAGALITLECSAGIWDLQ